MSALAAVIAEAMAPDALNPLFTRLHARSKETPAKTWWHAEALHPAIYRALRMDPGETGAAYAALPFRIHRNTDGVVRILAAFPTPRILAPHDDDDWLGIDYVLSWNPVDDTAIVMGDAGASLIGRSNSNDHAAIFASPFAYFRALAEARAAWLTGWYAIEGEWRQRPAEPDLTPGYLMLAKPDKVRWPVADLPRDLTCHGVDPMAVNRAILRQSALPRASAAPSSMMRAA